MKVPMLVGLLLCFLSISACDSDPMPIEGAEDVVSIRILTLDPTVPVGGQTRIEAEALDLAGQVVPGIPFSWSSSNRQVATVDGMGRVRGIAQGSAEITARILDVTASVPVTVVDLPPPPAGSPDPTFLPEASAQAPVGGFPYGANLSRGQSYEDPTSGVRVWRLTDASLGLGSTVTPSYASGPNQISMPREDGTRHVVVNTDGDHRILEWHATSGVSQTRRAPGGELRFSFSSVAETPGKGYYVNENSVYAYDVDSEASTRLVELGGGGFTWFQHDARDEWFAMMRSDGSETVAWNRLTGEIHVVETDDFDGSLDDIRIDREGRYVYLLANQEQPSGGSYTDLVVLDLESGELSDPQVRNTHAGAVRGFLVSHNPDLSDQEDFYFDPATETVTYTSLMTDRMNGHYAGQWVNGNDPGTLQWAVFSGWSSNPGRFVHNSILVFRIDGSDLRFLAHHGSSTDEYWDQPHATVSPDGHVVIWGSDMGGSNRIDTFLALLPVAEGS